MLYVRAYDREGVGRVVETAAYGARQPFVARVIDGGVALAVGATSEIMMHFPYYDSIVESAPTLTQRSSEAVQAVLDMIRAFNDDDDDERWEQTTKRVKTLLCVDVDAA